MMIFLQREKFNIFFEYALENTVFLTILCEMEKRIEVSKYANM